MQRYCYYKKNKKCNENENMKPQKYIVYGKKKKYSKNYHPLLLLIDTILQNFNNCFKAA
tara:strand:+ start:582 stop:758 length:177 start_codon:yes stop_codon:yes gene_type:complete